MGTDKVNPRSPGREQGASGGALYARAMKLRLLGLLGGLLFLPGCLPSQVVLNLSPPSLATAETRVSDDGRWNSPKLALIDVSGTLADGAPGGGLLNGGGPNPVARLDAELSKAAADPAVAAVVVRINSPGGTVTASELMATRLAAFRAATGRPVVAHLGSVATSGGYLLACSADAITAEPTSVTGSIGVIFQTVSAAPALERWGILTDAVVSGPNKDAGSPLSDLTPGQRETFEALVEEFAARFKERVREARPEATNFEEATDGRVFTGRQAVAWGYADAAGGVGAALALAKRLAGVDGSVDVARYHPAGVPVRGLLAAAPAASSNSALPGAALSRLEAAAALTAAGPCYLWLPGR